MFFLPFNVNINHPRRGSCWNADSDLRWCLRFCISNSWGWCCGSTDHPLSSNGLYALLSDFYPFICELISKYSCIDSKITTSFFSDPDYVLPTRKNITDKYGLDKSEATHILSRFRVKLRDQETVKKYFPDFI